VENSILLWLGPTLGAMFAWGIAQGLVKKYVGEVPPARFCLYYALANALVTTTFWYFKGTPDVFAEANRDFMIYGLGAYLLDGLAWIFYYQSIVYGPISIVGTLSAAYPAITILLARGLLDEKLSTAQYAGVFAVLAGCLMLAYTPKDPNAPPDAKKTQKRWMGFAGAALLIWGVNGVLIKKAYSFTGASEGNMALFIAIGGMCTLGVYGFLYGRKGATHGMARSFGPMAMMALGGLLATIAYSKGPASIVTPLSGAYPVITLTFAVIVLKERLTKLHWAAIVSILAGMYLTTRAPPAEEAAATTTTTTDASDGGPALASDAGSVPAEAPAPPATSPPPDPTPPVNE
jgi:drug/metabolite transporter (DMT)-like permease